MTNEMNEEEKIIEIQHLNKAIELDPGNLQLYVFRGIHLFHTQQYNKAIKDIEKTNESLPKNPEDYAMDYWMLGECYVGICDFDKAIYNFSKSIEFDPILSYPFSGHGYAYLKKGQLESAISDFNKAIELDSKNDRAYYYRADYWLTVGENAKAQDDLRTAVKLAATDYLKKNAEFKLRNLDK